jgi:hypothetical protein
MAFCTLLEWDGAFPFDRYAKSLKPKRTSRQR